jgi:hypothetical protein
MLVAIVFSHSIFGAYTTRLTRYSASSTKMTMMRMVMMDMAPSLLISGSG